MELALPQGDSLEPSLVRVTKNIKYANGLPIGMADDNLVLIMRIFGWGKASLMANYTMENLFTQVDDEGNQQVLIHEIINYQTNLEVKQQDAFVTPRTRTKQ